jgi:hypothetical protein
MFRPDGSPLAHHQCPMADVRANRKSTLSGRTARVASRPLVRSLAWALKRWVSSALRPAGEHAVDRRSDEFAVVRLLDVIGAHPLVHVAKPERAHTAARRRNDEKIFAQGDLDRRETRDWLRESRQSTYVLPAQAFAVGFDGACMQFENFVSPATPP